MLTATPPARMTSHQTRINQNRNSNWNVEISVFTTSARELAKKLGDVRVLGFRDNSVREKDWRCRRRREPDRAISPE